MPHLQVGIALSRNAEAYLEFLIWTASLTAHHPIHYVLGVNRGADIRRVEEIVREAGVPATVFEAHVDTGYGSMNHGMCLDMVLDRMTAGVGMLVDCDVAFLQPGWDASMLSTLDGTNVIVGAEYDGMKYRGFPNVIGAVFDVGVIKGLGISLKPEGHVTLTGESLLIYGYGDSSGPVSIMLDTGSELPRKVKAAGLGGIPMPLYRAGDPGAVFMREGLRGEEYQLNGASLFTHLGRSYTREFGANADALVWEHHVREWLGDVE